MKKWYKMAGAFLVITCGIKDACSQGTNYGTGSGSGGTNHSYFGNDAGKISTGSDNTFIGFQTGLNCTIGKQNTFAGSLAGLLNKGSYNTFLGYTAGKENSLGSENTFIGQNAGALNENGSMNCFVGSYANGEGANGNYNCVVGWRAGFVNTGDGNVLIGAKAGLNNDTGYQNSFVGNKSGMFNSIGFANTYFGSESGFLGSTGIGNAYFGAKAGYSNVTGHNNAFFGYGAGFENTVGEKNTYIGYGAGGEKDLINATAIGAMSKVTRSNSLVLGNNSNVGIGVSAPAYQLQLSSYDAAKLGSPLWTIWSDRRLKKDITDFTDGLEKLKQINPIWFSYNGVAGTKSGKRFVGVIAQDMQKIAPYMVGTFIYQDSVGNKMEYLDYDANALTYMLVNSVKEQQQIIEDKETKIQELSGQMEDLSKRLAQLERIVAFGTTKPLTTNPAARNEEPYSNGVMLYQNTPNGFSSSTSINYFIPEIVKEAVIHVYSTNGVVLFSEEIETRGEGTLKLSANDFSNGTYIYDLVTDGKSNGAKKMLVEK